MTVNASGLGYMKLDADFRVAVPFNEVGAIQVTSGPPCPLRSSFRRFGAKPQHLRAFPANQQP